MKKLNNIAAIIIILSLVFVTTTTLHAQTTDEGKSVIGSITPPDSSMNVVGSFSAEGRLGQYLGTIINISIYGGLIGVLIYLVYGGIQWISAGGDTKALDQARSTMTNAVIGLILLSIALVISLLLQSTILGISGQPAANCPPPQSGLPCP